MVKFAGYLLLGIPLLAAAESDWDLLQKAAQAGRHQALSGSYTHHVDDELETFRLYRAQEGGVVRERRESMDGMPRELVRDDNELTCYAPDTKALSAAKINAIKLFPAILPERSQDLKSAYVLSRGKLDRVARRDCQWLLLTPKEANLRYGLKVCVDPASALPLKTVTHDAKGAVIEQFAFSDLTLGNPKERALLRPRFKYSLALGAAVSAPQEVVPAEFEIRGMPTGFRLLRYATRQLPGHDSPVSHFVYTDGLAKLSLFVEAGKGEVDSHPAVIGPGGLGLASRRLGNQVLTVVGDLPEQGLENVINTVRVIKK